MIPVETSETSILTKTYPNSFLFHSGKMWRHLRKMLELKELLSSIIQCQVQTHPVPQSKSSSVYQLKKVHNPSGKKPSPLVSSTK